MQSFENYIIFNVTVWPHLTVYRTYLYIYIGIEIGKQCSFDRLITFSYLIRSSRMGQRFQLKAMGRMTRYFYVSTLDFDFYWHWHWLREQRAANAVRHIDALLLIIFGEMAELYLLLGALNVVVPSGKGPPGRRAVCMSNSIRLIRSDSFVKVFLKWFIEKLQISQARVLVVSNRMADLEES